MSVDRARDGRGPRGMLVLGAAAVLSFGPAVAAVGQPLATGEHLVGATRHRASLDAAGLHRGAPGRRSVDGWKVGGLAAAAAIVATADRRGDAWARRPGVRDDATLHALSRVGDVSGKYVALGVGPSSWLLGRARGDSGTAVLGLRATEAVLLSMVTISAIKAITGRTRPYASADHSPMHWDLFGGTRSDSTRSFASGHAAFAAAASVTMAAEWRRQGVTGWQSVGPPFVYALASLTAASRVRDRKHWLSDVLAGAAVGTASALIVRRWHDRNPGSRIDHTFLAR